MRLEHVWEGVEQVVDQLDVLATYGVFRREYVLHPDDVGVHAVLVEHGLHRQKIQELYIILEANISERS